MANLIVFTLILSVLTSAILITQTMPAQAEESSNEWPMFHQNSARTGLGSGDPISPNLIWNYTMLEGASSAVVADGVVYVICDNENLTAFNALNGSLLWSYWTDSFFPASPAVVKGVVYVGTYIGDVLAVDATNGVLLWDYQSYKDEGEGFSEAIDSSPAVVNGIVYVGSKNGNVYALNATTGERVWMYSTENTIESSPAVVEGILFIGSDDGRVYALNADTGALVWSYTVNEMFESNILVFAGDPAVANGVVYIAFEKGFYALNAHNGAPLWSLIAVDYRSEYSAIISPTVSGGIVYICARNGTFYALNAGNGEVIWAAADGWLTSSPAALGNIIYCGGRDGSIYALNAANGAKIWNYTLLADTEWGITSNPVVAYGVLYIGTSDGLYAIGNPEFSAPTPPPQNPTPTPAPSDPTVILLFGLTRFQIAVIGIFASIGALLVVVIALPTKTIKNSRCLALSTSVKAAIVGLSLSFIAGLFSNTLLISNALSGSWITGGLVIFAVNNFVAFSVFYLIGWKSNALPQLKAVAMGFFLATIAGYFIGEALSAVLYEYFFSEPLNSFALGLLSFTPMQVFPDVFLYLPFLYLFFAGMCALVLGAQRKKRKQTSQTHTFANEEEKT
ncbi:MAG: PQQ-binding-like beta-propeller repeat protein [Candidatus Bathyarchaeota archaeon]|nr:PQQ-binding-like beta-propeller repeat protein [Candidatus Bathyarchaeota archaeon]